MEPVCEKPFLQKLYFSGLENLLTTRRHGGDRPRGLPGAGHAGPSVAVIIRLHPSQPTPTQGSKGGFDTRAKCDIARRHVGGVTIESVDK